MRTTHSADSLLTVNRRASRRLATQRAAALDAHACAPRRPLPHAAAEGASR